MGYYDSDWQQNAQQGGQQGPAITGPFGGVDTSYQNLFIPQATQSLGGTNNPVTDPGAIQRWQQARLNNLGKAAPIQGMPSWMNNQGAQFLGQAHQSQDMLAQQAKQALAQANGAQTPQQVALAQQQGAQSGAMGSMARSVTGGARGAAAAAGTAVQQGAATQAAQAGQMTQQQLADKMAGAQLAGQLGNQQRQLAQQQYNVSGQQGVDTAKYQQGWQTANDQAAQWANTMNADTQIGNLGFQTGSANLNNQNQLFQQQLSTQMLGAGLSSGGSMMSGLGSWGGGGSSQPGGYNGTIYTENPYGS